MRRTAAAVLAALTACGHVDFAPPPPNLTPDQRVSMFHRLRGVAEQTIVTCSSRGGCTTRKSMFLADGTEVRHAEDVLPLLPVDHPATHAVIESDSARSRSRWFGLGAAAGLISGAFMIWKVEVDAWDTGEKDRAQQATGFTTLGLGIVLGVAAALSIRTMNRKKSEAFHWYTHGLAQRLNLCVSGLAVVPCEGSAPGQNLPVMPAPMPGPGASATPPVDSPGPRIAK
jgi:hypothetical protein